MLKDGDYSAKSVKRASDNGCDKEAHKRQLFALRRMEATEKWLPQSAPATTLVFSNKCPWRIDNVGLRHARISPATKRLGPETSVPKNSHLQLKILPPRGTEKQRRTPRNAHCIIKCVLDRILIM